MLHYLQGLLSALDLTSLLDAVLRVAAIFLCLTVHETCHGLAALALGDPTAKSVHRLSLNPLRHIDWLGLLMMIRGRLRLGQAGAGGPPVFPKAQAGHGPDRPGGAGVQLSAGAVVQCCIGAADVSLRTLFRGDRTWCSASCLYTLASLSIGLGLFNLIPIPPLDGSQGAGGVCCRTGPYITLMRYERYGIARAVGVVLCGHRQQFDLRRGIRGHYAAALLSADRLVEVNRFGKSRI